ncbi:hypothetical protein SODALDRAFT_324451 [Sodiomyces alkalinus F11]|uniref:Uncharacterized protein n=1 Tax=Sodiomyces alkalinus (strain CBS 110278 / VKM F-3762 / F11) TaxID=1314773 RepID=A0A3N2PU16_SODAK|nr:hypothetical protein SODALDRAFT_324451 [Sodiomyces alkalinus F11]ROT37997.1 hypothetical protein SODALDRAFT_324451 [Sodiomyces alkalinus F11]
MSGQAEYQGLTLSDIEQIDRYSRSDVDLSQMIWCMQQTGYHRWGFVVYRCTYSDDDAWARYVERMKQAAVDDLSRYGRDLLLAKYVDWTIVEDRDALDGASKADVRARFSEWAEPHLPDEDGRGPGAWRANALATVWRCPPTFRFCLFVDQECLDTLKAYEEWAQAGAQGRAPYVACIIIDSDGEPEGEGPDGYPAVDGCTRYDPGWMYTSVGALASLYDHLCLEELTDGYKQYARPPLLYPAHQRGISMPTLQEL